MECCRNEFNSGDITVICTYNKQLANLSLALKATGKCEIFLSEDDKENLLDAGHLTEDDLRARSRSSVSVLPLVRLASADSFQGQESKVIILSTVRSNLEGRTGFLNISNRVNVACSRARDGFYIFGNSKLLSAVPMWKKIINDFKRKGRIGTSIQTHCLRHPEHQYAISGPKDFKNIPACEIPCNAKLDCGHTCLEKCHKPELHSRMSCQHRCEQGYPWCQHECTRTCGERCGECIETVQIKLPECGHELSVACADAHKEHICGVKLEPTTLSCGHIVELACSTKDEPTICHSSCEAILGCGHSCSGKCSECQSSQSHAKCIIPCGRERECGHRCVEKCHTGDCPPCNAPCNKSCEHGSCSNVCSVICDPCVKDCQKNFCIHRRCSTICCLPCRVLPCNQPCTRLLACSHICPSLCGERCATKCVECKTGSAPTTTKMHLSCGHVFDLAFLDAKFKLDQVFRFDDDGSITGFQNLKDKSALRIPHCPFPSCGAICDNPRYRIFGQILDEQDTVDRLYKKLDRELQKFRRTLYDKSDTLDQNFGRFYDQIKAGPLAGKANTGLLVSRQNFLGSFQTKIIGFRGKYFVINQIAS